MPEDGPTGRPHAHGGVRHYRRRLGFGEGFECGIGLANVHRRRENEAPVLLLSLLSSCCYRYSSVRLHEQGVGIWFVKLRLLLLLFMYTSLQTSVCLKNVYQ